MEQLEYFQKPKIVSYYDVNPMKNILVEPNYIETQDLFQKNNQNYDLPIIIDYGSLYTKAGWGNSQEPNLVFRTFVNKTKGYKQKTQVAVISTQDKEIDIFKGNFRSPYERNIVQHFGLFENINDHIFNELGVEGESVNHPLMCTEATANPEYNRMNVLEQYFDCYGIPSVFMGIDSLFSYYYNLKNKEEYNQKTCLLVSVSNSTCHIIPILRGKILYTEIKRVNVGGQNNFDVFFRSVSLKNQHLKNYMNFNTIHALLQNETECTIDYQDQLKYFKTGKKAFTNKGYINQVEFNNNKIFQEEEQQNLIFEPTIIEFPSLKVELNEQEQEKKKQMRLKAADRLREAVAKKRQEQQDKQNRELEDLQKCQQLYQDDRQAFMIQAEQLFGPQNRGIDDVKNAIKKLKIKMGLISKEDLESEKYHLINVSESDLTADQKKLKRQQIMLKAAADARQEKKIKEKAEKENYQKWKESNPKKYLEELYDKRNEISKKIDDKKKQKQELTQRNSKLNLTRMQTLAKLGADENGTTNSKKIKDDNFGVNDDDWNVYLGISKHQDSDEENHEIKLNELEIELRELDPEFEEKIKQGSKNPYYLNMNENFIELGVDKIKGPEVLFQPAISGCESAGLSETITFVIKKFNDEDQKILLQNIQLTGGSSLIKGLNRRIQKDLQENFQPGTQIHISTVQDPILDSYRGMQQFYQNNPELIALQSIKKQDYEEHGGSNLIFKENMFSNVLIPKDTQIEIE